MAVLTEAYSADLRDEFRNDVLAAMDQAVNRIAYRVGVRSQTTIHGATDADLPELFRTLDAQLKRALARHSVILTT